VPGTSDRDELWIGEAAKYVGRSVRSSQAWDRDGILRPAGRSATNRRFYTKTQLDVFLGRRREAVTPTRVIVYCRVSSSAQKPDLINQKQTLESFCAARGLADVEWIDEVGGGLNFERKKFCAICDYGCRRAARSRNARDRP
jgi:putative resolvase